MHAARHLTIPAVALLALGACQNLTASDTTAAAQVAVCSARLAPHELAVRRLVVPEDSVDFVDVYQTLYSPEPGPSAGPCPTVAPLPPIDELPRP